MVRSAIFRRLLAAGIFLIAVSLAGLDIYLTRYTARRHIQEVERRLIGEARILSGELHRIPASSVETWAKEAGKRAQARVTLIDARGLVLADSHHDPESMENHADRPEVKQALEGAIGRSVRRSATLERDLSYVAVPVQYDGPAVLRLALPLEEVDSAIAEVRRRILGASLVTAVAALLIAYLFSRSFTRRIGRLKLLAESLLDQRASDRALPRASDEFDMLERSLTTMASEIRNLVERLRLESAQREAILASMNEGVLAVNDELEVIFCNQSFARAAGARYPLAARVSLLEVVRDPELRGMLAGVLANREPRKQRMQLRAGERRSFEVQAAPLDTGSRCGVLAVLHDITDLERLERVRKDFVANVSHELRTPLTTIRGYAETLLDGALEDRQNNRRFVAVIRAHAIRLNNIASDLLVISELDAGKPAAAPEPLSVRDALEAAMLCVEAEAGLRGVELRANIDDFKVMGQKIRLEQAFVNLLDNAVKFNRPGGQVTVQAEKADGKGRVVISDTGIGIPSAEAPRIFERFYRVDKARSREVGGTGLGLSIVKHVIENMGGTVAVESQLGKGSSFIVVLPC
jgi:two-component system phosphate regulon sensor histidine kinase PhoR